eukprot:scaffold230142_cov14-Tisochrysis_lutea.AAC.1
MLWAAAVLGIPLQPDYSASYFSVTQAMLPSLNGQVRNQVPPEGYDGMDPFIFGAEPPGA